MVDFGPKKDNFQNNFLLPVLSLSDSCCISPGFAFISSVHLSDIAIWQKFAEEIYNGGFCPEKSVFWSNFIVFAIFLGGCCSKSPGFGINTSVPLRQIAMRQKFLKYNP